jgi:hypothetical protein
MQTYLGTHARQCFGEEMRRSHPSFERTEALLKVLADIEPEKVPTSAAVWNVSRWNESTYGDSNGLYQPMLAALNVRNGGKANNVMDTLIGGTAIARGLTLVTNDRHRRRCANSAAKL